MSQIVIDVQDVSKLYRLGKIGTGSLRQDMRKWALKYVGKLPPDDTLYANESEFLWALQNISFQIKEGETWGIVGANGAGKSTLLKILSRIIRPTSGSIKGKGLVSSLLEVGTGFHSELTGRENIYISGHTMGMARQEIQLKFNDIVDFSGIERFIDTPVKRYSSGMYVRLAFAVAAFLEPDILIVDEVLAVGDAEFQKRCLGKMQDVSSRQGRTVIFVSHSMQAINNLCQNALWLDKGKLKSLGSARTVVNNYLLANQKLRLKKEWAEAESPGNEQVRLRSAEIIPQLANANDPVNVTTPIIVKFELEALQPFEKINTGLILYTATGECIFDVPSVPISCCAGKITGECKIPGKFLNDGSYSLSLVVVENTSKGLFQADDILSFDVEDYRPDFQWYGKWKGAVRPDFYHRLNQE